jgi:hypothetical protein
MKIRENDGKQSTPKSLRPKFEAKIISYEQFSIGNELSSQNLTRSGGF